MGAAELDEAFQTVNSLSSCVSGEWDRMCLTQEWIRTRSQGDTFSWCWPSQQAAASTGHSALRGHAQQSPGEHPSLRQQEFPKVRTAAATLSNLPGDSNLQAGLRSPHWCGRGERNCFRRSSCCSQGDRCPGGGAECSPQTPCSRNLVSQADIVSLRLYVKASELLCSWGAPVIPFKCLILELVFHRGHQYHLAQYHPG